MLKDLKKYFYKYSTTDIRLKLKFLKKKTNINFYPDYFNIKGFSSIYTRFIFFLLMFEKFYKELRIKYRKLFNTKFNYEKIFLINSLPRSGSTFLNNILSSERELTNNSGNGVPKYLNTTDRFIFNNSENKKRIPLNLFEICYEDLLMYDYRYYNKNKEAYNYNSFYFTHYPISKSDIVNNQKDLKQVFLLREPISSCLSNLKHFLNFDNFISGEKKTFDDKYIQSKLDTICINYKEFFKFIYKFKSNQNYLIISFDNLINSTFENVEKIYNFFNLSFSKENLEKSIKINSKENTINMLFKNKELSNRVSNFHINPNIEKDLIEKIKNNLKDEINKYPSLIK